MTGRTIRVLVIDDSALVRELLTRILEQEPGIEVIGTAMDPIYAIKMIKSQKPDVITLDLEMPRMDGLTFLRKLMSVYPLPVVVVSSLAKKGSKATLEALELGALDFVTKPAAGLSKGLEEMGMEIVQKVNNAADVNVNKLRQQARKGRMSEKSPSSREDKPAQQVVVRRTDRVVAIGASTGGTVAVKEILQQLSANTPGVIVVLHMPAGFTTSYAQSLNSSCRMKVKEAEDGDRISFGQAFIAPGGKHLLLEKKSSGYIIRLDNGPPVNRHRPSVDKTFFSVAEESSPDSMGLILTGMGGDGARGLKAMHDQGSPTLAQDEETSIVYGMPRQAVELGAVDRILPLGEMAAAIQDFVT